MRALLIGALVGIVVGLLILFQDAQACACAPVGARLVPNQDCVTGLSYDASGLCKLPDSGEELQSLVNNMPEYKRLQMGHLGNLPQTPPGFVYTDEFVVFDAREQAPFIVDYVNGLEDETRYARYVRGLLPIAPEGYVYAEDLSIVPNYEQED